MTRTKTDATDRRSEADELLNDKFHALLRDAADKREGRTQVHSA